MTELTPEANLAYWDERVEIAAAALKYALQQRSKMEELCASQESLPFSVMDKPSAPESE